jgi:epoxyqueuosine reductase
VSPIAIVVDQAFEPDAPTDEIGCPTWCKNVCLVACPTGALKGPRHLDPRKCISYLSYYDSGITARELREPMGVRIYGCDHCQNVCPRNVAWLSKKLPQNENVLAKEKYFDWASLLHMDREYFEKNIWPHMFYMPATDMWRWKMNVARAMGNRLDPQYIPDLIRAFTEDNDERVRGMAAWALGRIGGARARTALEGFLRQSSGLVFAEVAAALEMR